MKEQIKRNDLIYKLNKLVYDFGRFWRIRSFDCSIFNGKIIISEMDKKESNLMDVILKLLMLKKVYMVFAKVENHLLMLVKVEYFH